MFGIYSQFGLSSTYSCITKIVQFHILKFDQRQGKSRGSIFYQSYYDVGNTDYKKKLSNVFSQSNGLLQSKLNYCKITFNKTIKMDKAVLLDIREFCIGSMESRGRLLSNFNILQGTSLIIWLASWENDPSLLQFSESDVKICEFETSKSWHVNPEVDLLAAFDLHFLYIYIV